MKSARCSVAGIETGRIIPGSVNRNKGWFHPNHVLEEGDPRLLDVVRGAGIEPARNFPHRTQILLMRLPVFPEIPSGKKMLEGTIGEVR